VALSVPGSAGCGNVRSSLVPALWIQPAPLAALPGMPPAPGNSGDVMLALGDSFSSGEGAPNSRTAPGPVRLGQVVFVPPLSGGGPRYLPGTDREGNYCHRSVNAYGPRVALTLGLPLVFAACSGAKITDYWNPNGEYRPEPAQQDVLTRYGSRASLVTLSMGGNNIGFGDVVAKCLGLKVLDKHGPASCVPDIRAAEARLGTLDTGDQRQQLPYLYADVRRLAPRARVLVLGYPRLFATDPPDLCPVGSVLPLLHAEMVEMNRLVDSLDAIIRHDAESAGFDYVDVSGAFSGHDVCVDRAGDRWVNRLHDPTRRSSRDETFHPTAAGQQAFADAVLVCYRDRAVCSP
jgi:lysophospholipase L1-like esterase